MKTWDIYTIRTLVNDNDAAVEKALFSIFEPFQEDEEKEKTSKMPGFDFCVDLVRWMKKPARINKPAGKRLTDKQLQAARRILTKSYCQNLLDIAAKKTTVVSSVEDSTEISAVTKEMLEDTDERIQRRNKEFVEGSKTWGRNKEFVEGVLCDLEKENLEKEETDVL